MDLIILGVGLTIILTRDIYRHVRQKRRNRKLKKKQQLAAASGDALYYSYDPDFDAAFLDPSSPHPENIGSGGRATGVRVLNERGRGVPIAAPRTSRNHPDRPVTPPPMTAGARHFLSGGSTRDRRRDPRMAFYLDHPRDTDAHDDWDLEAQLCAGDNLAHGTIGRDGRRRARVPSPPPAYSPPQLSSTVTPSEGYLAGSSASNGSSVARASSVVPESGRTSEAEISVGAGNVPPPTGPPPSFELAMNLNQTKFEESPTPAAIASGNDAAELVRKDVKVTRHRRPHLSL